MFDIMMIGPATRDINIDYTRDQVEEIGGAVFFGTYAARAAGAKVFAAVKANERDQDIIQAFDMPPDSIALLSSSQTTRMQNQYFTPSRERRKASCLAQSDSINGAEIPPVKSRLFHLAGLLHGDFPEALIVELAARGKLSADIQSFLRHNEGGNMNFHDWKEKLKFLPYFDYLKTDAAEAEILTGTDDRRRAAQMIHEWGAKEIMISHNSEMMIYDGTEFYTCPVKARNLSGRTGRGDTTFAAYLARRMRGEPIAQALLFATAMVSLKMETSGPFRGNEQDVFEYIRDFYS